MNRNSKKESAPGLSRLAVEYAAVGVVMSLLSAFLGFYSAAYILAEKCYPELGLETVQAIHRAIFTGLPLVALVYGAALAALYWAFARLQLRRLAAADRRAA